MPKATDPSAGLFRAKLGLDRSPLRLHPARHRFQYSRRTGMPMLYCALRFSHPLTTVPFTFRATSTPPGVPMHAAEMLDAVDGGLVFVDRDLHVLFFNAWFAAPSRTAGADAIGVPLDHVMRENVRAKLATAVSAALDGMATVLSHNLHGPIFKLLGRSGHPLIHDVSIQARQARRVRPIRSSICCSP